jgi:hypothetical protein
MASRFDDAVFAAMQAAAPLNMDKATELAEQFGEKPRAIVAAAIRAGIPYERKARMAKNGAPVASKEDLVAQISEKVGADLSGLEKATKEALRTLLAAV